VAVRPATEVANEILEQIQRLDSGSTPSIRRVRVDASKRLHSYPGEVLAEDP